MLFWIIVFFSFICGFIIFDLSRNDVIKKIIFFIIVAISWYIMAFRYYIGFDYSGYVTIFNSVDGFENINIWYENLLLGIAQIEPTILLISGLLKEMDFKFQMMFVVYATVMYFFFCLGTKYWGKNNYKLMIAVVAMFLVERDFYFYFMSVIRQSVAIAIVFWSAKFIEQKKFHFFIVSVLFAMLWHYSAIVSLFLIPLRKVNITKMQLTLLIILSFLLVVTGVGRNVINSILDITGMYVAYIGDGEVATIGTYISIILISCLLLYSNGEENRLAYNATAMGVILTILGLDFGIILRAALYFKIFFLVIFAFFTQVGNAKYYAKYAVIVLCVALLLNNINNFDNQSNIDARSNVHYEANFDLKE